MVTDPTRLARWTVAATWLWLIASIATLLTDAREIVLLGGLGGPIAPPEALTHIDQVATITGFCWLIGYALAAVLSLRLIYVVNRNAQQWSDRLTITPLWNVLWFFVPVANLYRPFDGIRQTWRATIDPDAPETVPTPKTMRWWWGLWLAVNALGWGSIRAGIAARTPVEYLPSLWLSVASDVLAIPLTILFVRLIDRLSARQRDRLA